MRKLMNFGGQKETGEEGRIRRDRKKEEIS